MRKHDFLLARLAGIAVAGLMAMGALLVSSGVARSARQDLNQYVAYPYPYPPTVTLKVVLNGSGVGTVTGGGIACPDVCSVSVPQTTSITLIATPVGSTFGGWSGGCSGTSTMCTVTMSADQTVTATFAGTTTMPITTITTTTTTPTTGTETGTGTATPTKTTTAAAPSCKLRSGSARVLLKAPKKGKSHTPVGVLKLSATCDQALAVTLNGSITAIIKQHRKTTTRTFKLSPLPASLAPGIPSTLTVKLPSAALKLLARGDKLSAAFALAGTGAGGPATARAHLPKVVGSG